MRYPQMNAADVSIGVFLAVVRLVAARPNAWDSLAFAPCGAHAAGGFRFGLSALLLERLRLVLVRLVAGGLAHQATTATGPDT